MSEIIKTEVPSQQEGRRIDAVLSDLYPDRSRSYFQKMLEEGHILVEGRPVRASRKVRAGEEILLDLPEVRPLEVEAKAIPLDIIHEDDDILIVNKPKNMVVHPAAGHTDDTLVNAILYHCRDGLSGINGVQRPGIVHRIDKDTTGTLVICKNDRAHLALAEQLKVHSITRIYRGIVIGHLPEEEGRVDRPLGRDKKDRKHMAIVPDGKRAVTHYKVLQRLESYDDCEFRLETGRTHQIRVHMASLGHPLLGDETYGPRKCPFKLEGQCLHAMTIGFLHPADGRYAEYSAPLPEYYQKLLLKLKGEVL